MGAWKGYPNIETLITLSDLFNISIDELIKGDDFLKDKIIKEGKGELKWQINSNGYM